MRKQRKPNKKSNPTVSKDEEIPSEISSLIKTRTVTIPDNERFFTKEWEAMLPIVGSHAKHTGGSFELGKALFEKFMVFLRRELRQKDEPRYEQFKPSDWIAQALCNAAELLVPDEDEDIDDRLWPDGRPISEAWQKCKNSWLWHGDPRTEILEEPGEGAKLRPLTRGPIRHPRVEIVAANTHAGQVGYPPNPPQEVWHEQSGLRADPSEKG